jgi:hypothetical protein
VGTDALTNIDSTEIRKIPVEDDEVWNWIGLALDWSGFGLVHWLRRQQLGRHSPQRRAQGEASLSASARHQQRGRGVEVLFPTTSEPRNES